jgi:hypothetical protein
MFIYFIIMDSYAHAAYVNISDEVIIATKYTNKNTTFLLKI